MNSKVIHMFENWVYALQQECQKRGLSPVYHDLGQPQKNSSVFLCQVNAGNYEATGKGLSKKGAKYAAAEKVLQIMRADKSNDQTSATVQDQAESSTSTKSKLDVAVASTSSQGKLDVAEASTSSQGKLDVAVASTSSQGKLDVASSASRPRPGKVQKENLAELYGAVKAAVEKNKLRWCHFYDDFMKYSADSVKAVFAKLGVSYQFSTLSKNPKFVVNLDYGYDSLRLTSVGTGKTLTEAEDNASSYALDVFEKIVWDIILE